MQHKGGVVVQSRGGWSFFSFGWDGTTINGKMQTTVPNGTYVMKMSVLKANGDANNPAHWETFTTPVITVARP